MRYGVSEGHHDDHFLGVMASKEIVHDVIHGSNHDPADGGIVRAVKEVECWVLLIQIQGLSSVGAVVGLEFVFQGAEDIGGKTHLVDQSTVFAMSQG